MTELTERLNVVRSRVADAVSSAGRDVSDVTLIVVTKFHPSSLVRELAAHGVTDIGENRHQEAKAKSDELADLALTWHFVGQLQTNKAKQVRSYADVVHSVDRPALVDALRDDGDDLDCFVQVNLTDDPARGGAAVGDLERLADRVVITPGLRLMGVMTVAPLGEEPARAFERVQAMSERIRSSHPQARFISAGMSGDYEDAIRAGATHLRIGSAITGMRPARG